MPTKIQGPGHAKITATTTWPCFQATKLFAIAILLYLVWLLHPDTGTLIFFEFFLVPMRLYYVVALSQSYNIVAFLALDFFLCILMIVLPTKFRSFYLEDKMVQDHPDIGCDTTPPPPHPPHPHINHHLCVRTVPPGLSHQQEAGLSTRPSHSGSRWTPFPPPKFFGVEKSDAKPESPFWHFQKFATGKSCFFFLLSVAKNGIYWSFLDHILHLFMTKKLIIS